MDLLLFSLYSVGYFFLGLAGLLIWVPLRVAFFLVLLGIRVSDFLNDVLKYLRTGKVSKSESEPKQEGPVEHGI